MRTISESRFWEHYQPLENIKGWGDMIWEYEEVISAKIPIERVWTVIEDDRGRDLYASPGFHTVNTLGYLVTQEPWTDPARDAMYMRR